MMARWQKDIDHVSLVLAFLGSIRPSARTTLYHPVCAAFCAVVGVLLASTSENILVAMIGFLFIPMNNWLAGLFFSLLAAVGGWVQLFACVWGFAHVALDQVKTVAPMSAARQILLYTSDRLRRHSEV